METETIDANTETESSTVSNGDVKPGTISSEVQTQETQKDVKVEPTIQSIAKAAFDKSVAKESSTKAEEGQDGVVQSLNDTKKEESEEGKKEDTTTEKTEELPPFHEHPRWKEVTSQRDEFKTKVAEMEPAVKAHQSVVDYCQTNGISEQEYREGLQLIALSKKNPQAFYEKLQEVVKGFAPVVGDVLTPELQKAVDDGEITLAYAQKLSKAEAQTKLGQREVKLTTEQQAERLQQQFVQGLRTAVATWESTTMGNDPDFVAKAKPTDPDGKYEWFLDKFGKACSMADFKNPSDAVALAVKCYGEVNAAMGRFKPNGTTRKVLSSTKSSTTTITAPKNIAEVVKMTAAKHGL